MKFETRPLGRTALEVTTLGLGGATLGGNMAHLTDADSKILVLEAFNSGIRYFDTAPFYGYGRSERIVGDELRGLEDWVLSTKVGRRLRPRHGPQATDDAWRRPLPFEPYFDYSYDGVMRSYEDSLQRLGLNRIDILYIHDPDTLTHGPDLQPEMYAKAMDGAAKALEELRRNGDVKAIGLGVNEAMPIAKALDHAQWDCFLLAGRYTLLEQDPLETLFPALEAHGATVVVGGPFNSGVLVGRETWNYIDAPEEVMSRVKAIGRVCEAHNVPLAAAALKFPLAHPVVSSVIPGPRSAEELNQILEWWQADIPGSLWSDLKNEKLIPAGTPVPA
ncbi:MAG: aldo/keto reductase [Hyphomicrobiales bacterium]|nr:aldo/keto reductase [Hyphomicrobiales bacterium]